MAQVARSEREGSSLGTSPTPGRRLRILYFHPDAAFNSGSPKALASCIASLDPETFEPVCCIGEDGPLTAALNERGVEIVSGEWWNVSYRRPFASLASIWRQAKRIRSWNIDLLHVNGLLWNTDLILAAWMLGIPVIVHVHNPVTVDFRNLVRFAARKVLFCSQTQMKATRHFERIAHKSEVLYNSVDTAGFGSGVAIRPELGVRDNEVAIGTVATVLLGKGIDILMETAEILLRERQDLVFLVAGAMGPREEEFVRRMQARSEEPGLRGHVRFLGSRSDIPDLLASMDLFFLPTRGETFGIALIEAMAAGVPVIASRVGGIPEILSSPEIGRMVDPIAPEAFAQAIREILALPDRGRGMAEKARLSVAQRFDIASAGERLKKIYLDLL